jgi:hypothetical protein
VSQVEVIGKTLPRCSIYRRGKFIWAIWLRSPAKVVDAHWAPMMVGPTEIYCRAPSRPQPYDGISFPANGGDRKPTDLEWLSCPILRSSAHFASWIVRGPRSFMDLHQASSSVGTASSYALRSSMQTSQPGRGHPQTDAVPALRGSLLLRRK